MRLDAIDRRILDALQADATIQLADLAKEAGLSPTPCWRRVKNLEEAGVIRCRVALLDRAKLNLNVTVFVAIRTNQHTPEWLERFARAVLEIPEVVDFYRMSGDIDYLLRVVVPDIAAYDEVYKRLIKRIDLYDVSSSFAMEEIKCTTALPVRYADAVPGEEPVRPRKAARRRPKSRP
ncbi:MAG: Lrp/AsnC family transcriptional regulator [Alphaproteobacteria bacterium]|nr:Lrp/AsnC family transcriptional regulator [Alphaproteobacteria bacterium]